MFLSKALRRAEVFLEQVDESVAQASRRLVVEGATGAVNEADTDLASDEETSSVSRSSSIPKAETRARSEALSADDQVSEDLDDDTNVNSILSSSNDAKPELSVVGVTSSKISKAKSKADGITELTTSGYQTATSESQPAPVKTTDSLPITHSQVSTLPVVNPSFIQSSKSQSVSSTGKPYVGTEVVNQVDPFVQALQAENDDLRKELENIESEFDQSRRERSKLVKNLKRMKEIVSELDESLRDKSAEVRHLNDQLLKANTEAQELNAKRLQKESDQNDELNRVRKELHATIDRLQSDIGEITQQSVSLRQENEQLKEALLKGHEVELATADGARQEASQAHRAYEAESHAHRQTRQQAKEREEALEEEAAIAARALAAAQRKAEECIVGMNEAKAAQRATDSKLVTVSQARDAAFARIDDLTEILQLYQRNEGQEAPGQREAKAMHQTILELENALEAKNVELNRLEGELETIRVKLRKDGHSPRTPNANRNDIGNLHEVELKMRHMADAALRKQAQLEVLRSENRAFQHQLLTERKRTREAQAMAAAASSSCQSIRGGFRGFFESGDENNGRAYGVRDGPLARFRTPRNWPTFLTKLVVGTDRFCAQALAFLRKEPLLRITVLIYIIAIHLLLYSLLHWHVSIVSGSVDSTQGRIASAANQQHLKL